ncbi:MAG: energy transducer TonB [Deltaproteobacteria bacterium]|nr:energy transducer TonB [Deltaproteobacteria bacterium]
MRRRIALAVAAAVLLHAALAIFLVWLSAFQQRRVATLSDAGGVVWYNLNPGGAGSGGEGGLGAPQAADPKAATPKSEGMAPTPSKPDRKSDEVLTARPAKAIPAKPPRLKVIPKPPVAEERAERPTEKASLPPGLPGPGEGDVSGARTGPGGGEGAGLGGGEGTGSGGGKGPGGVGAPGSGGSGSGGEASAILARIRQKIARAKRYPRQARSEELEGVAGLQFEINADGSVAYVNLTSSSGHRVLDEEAVATVRRAAPFPYYAGPIRFSLRFSLKDNP